MKPPIRAISWRTLITSKSTLASVLSEYLRRRGLNMA